MAKFTTGFLLGAAVGTAYALLTAKKTGAQRVASASQYVDSLTEATNGVQHAVTRFGNAMKDLRHELDTTLKPAVDDIQASVDDFNFQTQPRVDAINEHLDAISKAADSLNTTIDEH
ncbi:YtxH domain-containing protein [Lacticaseibacillus porcinae]|uniref:YtxH domain-containing protein n=1 Tax=Lacticaseibacillus porcinae TaxID=1123687 RepID=UPI000F77ED2F|nr:YtxH domain-containing protein [Lacticaseibacillus porcinae]